MIYNIIADAGSTKVDWALVASDGTELPRFSTPGLNALMADADDIRKMLDTVAEHLGADNAAGDCHYYGAGCATPAVCSKIEDAIYQHLSPSSVHVTTDLLAAARATLRTRRGVACILGTGSNSCLYDGEKIIENVPSLGFILGDEGSGAALGKRLVSDAFKGSLPELIKEKLLESRHLTLTEILENVYRRPNANRFLASLVPFLSENIWNPYVYSLILKEFSLFFERNVTRYRGAHSLPVTFTGSLAHHFEKILREAAQAHGFTIDSIVRSPLDGLVNYHKHFSTV